MSLKIHFHSHVDKRAGGGKEWEVPSSILDASVGVDQTKNTNHTEVTRNEKDRKKKFKKRKRKTRAKTVRWRYQFRIQYLPIKPG